MLSSDNEAQKGTTKDNFSFSQKFTIEMNARQFSDRYRSRIGYAKPVTNNHEAYFGQRERSLQKW